MDNERRRMHEKWGGGNPCTVMYCMQKVIMVGGIRKIDGKLTENHPYSYILQLITNVKI